MGRLVCESLALQRLRSWQFWSKTINTSMYSKTHAFSVSVYCCALSHANSRVEQHSCALAHEAWWWFSAAMDAIEKESVASRPCLMFWTDYGGWNFEMHSTATLSLQFMRYKLETPAPSAIKIGFFEISTEIMIFPRIPSSSNGWKHHVKEKSSQIKYCGLKMRWEVAIYDVPNAFSLYTLLTLFNCWYLLYISCWFNFIAARARVSAFHVDGGPAFSCASNCWGSVHLKDTAHCYKLHLQWHCGNTFEWVLRPCHSLFERQQHNALYVRQQIGLIWLHITLTQEAVDAQPVS